MCLTTLIKKDVPKSGVGYKVFKKIGGKLYGPFESNLVKTREWITDNPYRLSLMTEASPKEPYSPGFHIMETLAEAENLRKGLEISYIAYSDIPNPEFVIYKISYSKLVAYGDQTLYGYIFKVLVAKKMKLIRKIREKA